jgi:oxepin-CoA hydrolase/3-oxo-5,6-dehydrosuberyl-CoA semialdehyde dehydrogenase
MHTVRSYVLGEWYEAEADFVTLTDPSSEEAIARVSSAGIDFGEVMRFAAEGGRRLREMTFAERGAMLKGLSGALKEGREELLDLSRRNNGTTLGGGSFDIDGASGTLYYYSTIGRGLGERKLLPDGEGAQLARTEGFWAQHVLSPRTGVAVHINAFNFPCWGFAEKAACALLAGMPVVTKPATATAWVAARAVEMMVDSGHLPEGALQMVCGSTGDLLDRLGGQDVLAFTGSAATAEKLRNRDNIRRTNTSVNVEADSLNAAVLAPDATEGDTFNLFVKDVAREMTQKAGQKCTAVRRILVPRPLLEVTEAALTARLERTRVGDPAEEGVWMGPLASSAQLDAARSGVSELGGEVIFQTPAESLPGQGFFYPVTLLRAENGEQPGPVHELEVFGPVASVIPYDGTPGTAAGVVALAGGTLVTSVYSDDSDWLEDFLAGVASSTGRIYVGSQGSAEAAPGSGAAMPQALHGGPGRAGGGAELGGQRGLELYMQRVAVQGDRGLVEGLAGLD